MYILINQEHWSLIVEDKKPSQRGLFYIRIFIPLVVSSLIPDFILAMSFLIL